MASLTRSLTGKLADTLARGAVATGAGAASRGPQYGAELVINGGFGADTDWTKGAGWTILSAVASFDGSGGSANMDQAFAQTSSVNYEVTYTVSAFVSGPVTVALVGGATTTGTARSANGTFTEVLAAPAALATLRFLGTIGGSFSIDNVSVRRKFY